MSDHIQIGAIAPRVQYVADGVQTVFTYPFPIFQDSDLEVRLGGLVQGAGFTVAGAGQSAGGAISFAVPPPATQLVTLRRNLVIERTTDFQANGVLRANTLNDELDYQVAALQEVKDELSAALHLDPSEQGASTTLPLRPARANKLLGFDSVGGVAVFDRGDALIGVPFPGAVPRTVEDKLAERLTARDFGAVGDGAADDGPALQAAMNAAAASGKHLEIGEGTFRTTMPLSLPGAAAGLTMRGLILYAGSGGGAALTIGDGGTVKNSCKLYEGLRVLRSTQSDWSSEADIGLVLRNLDCCVVEVRQAEGFTIGVRTMGDQRGFAECTVSLGRIVNNKIGLDLWTATAAAWNTSVRYYGGMFSVGTTVNPGQDRFGVRLSAAPGAYIAHNRHVFHSPAFALQGQTATSFVGIPFLSNVSSRGIIVQGLRMEGCSPYVARHTGGAQDHVYEVAWASQGYGVSVDYASGSSRAGAVVRALHQAAAHREASRVLAAVDNLRSAAFTWDFAAGTTGFDRLACLSTNVSGSPTTLAGFAFPGLDSYTLNNRGAILQGGRGLGFVVDARNCREFALAVDADSPRLIVQTFDASMNLLDNSGGQLVLASGMSMTYGSTTRWWQGSANLEDADLTRLQVVHLAPQVGYAVIGVARIDTDYEVRAMRLLCDPSQAPPVLWGLPDLPFGSRQLQALGAWTPPAIAAGGTAQINIPLTGARPGDYASAAYSLATSGIVFLAQVGATDLVTVTAYNRSGGSVTLSPGTVRARVTKA